MSTLLELPTATIEWALLSPLIVLLGVGCVGIVLEGVVPRGWRYLAQTALTAVGHGSEAPTVEGASRTDRRIEFSVTN